MVYPSATADAIGVLGTNFTSKGHRVPLKPPNKRCRYLRPHRRHDTLSPEYFPASFPKPAPAKVKGKYSNMEGEGAVSVARVLEPGAAQCMHAVLIINSFCFW
jgi:hypothetical protein